MSNIGFQLVWWERTSDELTGSVELNTTTEAVDAAFGFKPGESLHGCSVVTAEQVPWLLSIGITSVDLSAYEYTVEAYSF